MINEVEENKGDFKFPLTAKFGDAAKNTLRYCEIRGLDQFVHDNTKQKTLLHISRSCYQRSMDSAILDMPVEDVVKVLQEAYTKNKIADFSPLELKF